MKEKSELKRKINKYDCLNRANSFIGSMLKHCLSRGLRFSLPDAANTLLNGGVELDAGQENVNGIIVLPRNVAALWKQDKAVIGTVGRKIDRMCRRFNSVEKRASIHWSVGSYFYGKYFEKSGKCFDASSLSIAVTGAEDGTLFRLAELVCLVFGQEMLLLKLGNGMIFLVKGYARSIPYVRKWLGGYDMAVIPMPINGQSCMELKSVLLYLGFGLHLIGDSYFKDFKIPGKKETDGKALLAVNLCGAADFRDRIFQLSRYFLLDGFLFRPAGGGVVIVGTDPSHGTLGCGTVDIVEDFVPDFAIELLAEAMNTLQAFTTGTLCLSRPEKKILAGNPKRIERPVGSLKHDEWNAILTDVFDVIGKYGWPGRLPMALKARGVLRGLNALKEKNDICVISPA